MARLGFGWMGSKNGIAKELIAVLPSADVFVDLFAGGCAMTHAAMLSGKYKRFIANDVKGTAVFFKEAIEGRVPDLYEWISREEFNARKDADIKVAAAWSFGNSGRQYLWGRDIQDVKLAAFKMLTLPTVEERYAAYKEFVGELGRKGDTAGLGQLEPIARLQGIKQLQSLNVLQGIKRLAQLDADALTVCAVDYRQVEIPANAVVYCDPPYLATYAAGKDYRGAHINNADFWQWVDAQDYPVFVSEYTAPEGFSEVWSTVKRCTMKIYANNGKPTTERLFVQARYAGAFMKGEAQDELFVNSEQLEASA